MRSRLIEVYYLSPIKKEGRKYHVINSHGSAEIDISTKLKNGLLDGLTAEQKQKIQYHSNNCHSPYVLKGSRLTEKVPDDQEDRTQDTSCLEVNVPQTITNVIFHFLEFTNKKDVLIFF